MSVTGPGCEHCHFKGKVNWDGRPFDRHVDHLRAKPCDHCGGLSQLGDPATAATRRVEADAIVRDLAECKVTNEGEDWSGLICELCHVHVEAGDFALEQHAVTCPWLRARKYVAGGR